MTHRSPEEPKEPKHAPSWTGYLIIGAVILAVLIISIVAGFTHHM